MEEVTIFQQKQEIERLGTQEDLFAPYEQPVYEKVLAQPRKFILDIGANDGRKTVSRFSNPSIQKVIGLEWNEDLVQLAQDNCADRRFSFYLFDVEDPPFAPNIREIMEAQHIPAFDVIHLSFVLMHLGNPAALLEKVRPLLAPEGVLMVIDVNDELSAITPDKGGAFLNSSSFCSLTPVRETAPAQKGCHRCWSSLAITTFPWNGKRSLPPRRRRKRSWGCSRCSVRTSREIWKCCAGRTRRIRIISAAKNGWHTIMRFCARMRCQWIRHFHWASA